MSAGSKKFGLRPWLAALWVLDGNSRGTDAHLLSQVPVTPQCKASCIPCWISILSDPPEMGFVHSGAHTLLGWPFSVYLFGGIASFTLLKGQFLPPSQLPSIHPPIHPVFWVYTMWRLKLGIRSTWTCLLEFTVCFSVVWLLLFSLARTPNLSPLEEHEDAASIRPLPTSL